MCLINNDALRRNGQKVLTVTFAFDVVKADHNELIMVKERNSMGNIPLQPVHTGGGEGYGLDMKVCQQFMLPLFHQMRRRKDGSLRDFSTIKKLSNDESCLYGFTNTDIVGNKQPNSWQAQGHKQRNELIGTWFDRDIAK